MSVASLGPGASVGRYIIVERIGSGGMAEIYRASLKGDYGYRKQVVLKMVLPHLAGSEDYIQMFLDESRLTASLAHPNLPQTYELGRHEGRHFLAMEYVSGVSLWHLVQRVRERRVEVPLAVALRLVCQLLECLHYVHGATDEQGRPLRIVHRDVSPGNLLITDDGALKLLDFGIARARLQEHHTAVGVVKGKMGFMSPEQARGDAVDHRTDLYAAGSLLYLLSVGVGPFEHLSDTFAVLQATATGMFRPPTKVKPGFEPAVERVILKALETNADRRYPSAGSMLDELEALAPQLRVVPSSRAVAQLMRELFPERAPAARTLDVSMVQELQEPPPLPTETTASERPSRQRLPPVRVSQQDTIAEHTESPADSATMTPSEPSPVVVAPQTTGPDESFPEEKTYPLAESVNRLKPVPAASRPRMLDDSSGAHAIGRITNPDSSSVSTARAGFPALKQVSMPALVVAGLVALLLLAAGLFALSRPSASHRAVPLREFPQPK